MPFLTLLDPRARLKGSRDPLGLQPLWSRFGRRVIGNLTTVTASLRGFTTLLLGLYFAEQVAEEKATGLDRQDADLVPGLFLRFEQLAAYSRVAVRRSSNPNEDDEDEIRGLRRVLRFLAEDRDRVWISDAQEHQILASQKTYGLWGLYTVAARNSGWLEPGTVRLTATARDFVQEEYLPLLERDGARVLYFLRGDHRFEPLGGDSRLAGDLAGILGPSLTTSERRFYAHHLLHAAGDDVQRRLWEHICAVNASGACDWNQPFSMPELREVIKHCDAHGDERMAQLLQHICLVETVIAPAGRLFGFLLSRDGQTAPRLAQEIAATWGASLPHLQPDAFTRVLAEVDSPLGAEGHRRLAHLAEALASGRYRDAIDLLLAQNKAVMLDRGSAAPWAVFKDYHLDVRFREEAGDLPAREDLPDLWVNSYFLSSLKRIGYQIEGDGNGR